MKIAELPERQECEAVGQCIYCGSREALTREHIIPLALGGEVILPEASCDRCRGEVGKYERFCLNQTFIQARTFLKLPMQDPQFRPKDLRVGRFRGVEQFPDMTDNLEWENIPVEGHPASIVVPVYEQPRLLTGLPRSDTFDLVGNCSRFLNEGPILGGVPDGRRTGVFIPFKPDALLKFVAKIAHGAAVATLGLESFEPLLCKVVRNEDPYISTLVGSDKLNQWPSRKSLHHVELSLKRNLILARVQLFARYGINPFLAVVGTPTETLLDRLRRY